MRKAIVFLIVFKASIGIGACQLHTKVDERFELTSIVFRLAGANEYVNNDLSSYVSDIDTYFNPYKDHPVVEYAKEIRQQYGIAYDAIPASTNLLEINGGHITIKPGFDTAFVSETDGGWQPEVFWKYASLIDDFYVEGKFHDFMPRLADFTNHIAQNFEQIQQENENKRPRVVSVSPDFSSDVSLQDVSEILVTFSEEMWSSSGMRPMDDESVLPVLYSEIPYWKDLYTFMIPIREEYLEHGKTYGFVLPGNIFRSRERYDMGQDFEFKFKIPKQ